MALTLRGIGTTTGEPFAGERAIESGEVLRIGRALENDWVLADPTCQVSKRHCAVSHEGDRFVVTDFSTNGVFFGEETTPVGRGATRPLTDGQTLQIGVYRFAVTVEAAAPAIGAAPAIAATPAIGVAPPPSAVSVSSILDGTAPEGEARAAASLGRPSAEWLAGVPAGTFAKATASGQVGWDAPPDIGLAMETRAPAAEIRSSRLADHSEHAAAVHAVVRLPESQQALPSDWNEPLATARPDGAGNVAVLRPAGQTADHGGVRRLVFAFLDGAGLPGDALDAMNQEIALREAGRMLRVAIDGTRKLLAGATLFETELAVARQPASRERDNALRSSNDAPAALKAMIGPPRPGCASGSATMSESFDRITAHEMALVNAFGDVIAKLAAELDPASIRARSDAKDKRLLLGNSKARYWDAFEAGCGMLRTNSPGSQSLAEVATRLLADAYAQQLREI
jgi:type VI secretion system FHA domain protein